MDIGFIGLGRMGFPMARRLIEAGHHLIVFDTRKEMVGQLVARGADQQDDGDEGDGPCQNSQNCSRSAPTAFK